MGRWRLIIYPSSQLLYNVSWEQLRKIKKNEHNNLIKFSAHSFFLAFNYESERVAFIILDMNKDYVYIKELDKLAVAEKGVFEKDIKVFYTYMQ